jgi:hypothetical protein
MRPAFNVWTKLGGHLRSERWHEAHAPLKQQRLRVRIDGACGNSDYLELGTWNQRLRRTTEEQVHIQTEKHSNICLRVDILV